MLRVACGLAALVALVTTGAARSAPERVAANQRVFSDARGENATGVDISRVVVSSTNDGSIVFRVQIPTNARFTQDMRIEISIDADLDERTGLGDQAQHPGTDYVLLADRTVTALYGCSNPPTCNVFAPRQGALDFSYRNGATLTVNTRNLGATKRFRFFVGVYDNIVTPDLTGAHFDFGPSEGGWWTFDTRALVAKHLSATPKAPRSGAPFTLRLTTIRTATGQPLTAGTVSCTLRIGRQALASRSHGFVGRRAVCAYDIPRVARRAPYRAAITVRAGPNAVSRSLSGRVG